jgi:probable addiction module antidote protein
MTIETTPFDAADYLDNAKDIAFYLEEAFAMEDPAYTAHALGTVARAKGMTEVASKRASHVRACKRHRVRKVIQNLRRFRK